RYISKIHNGIGRREDFNVPFAVIPAEALFRRSRQYRQARFESAQQVRRYFRLGSRTSCIISCISTDDNVEGLWNGLSYRQLAPVFARLKPAAVIVPNYSFF